MKNPRLVEAIKVASKASYSAWHSASYPRWPASSACWSAYYSAYSAYSAYVSVPRSASYSSKLDKEAVLKIIKGNMKQSCKNCKFSEFALTEKGNIKTSVSGSCLYEVEKPKFPDSVMSYYQFRHFWPPYKMAIWANEGINCEVYEPKNNKENLR